MNDFLYRFRSIDALIGERAELERQEIYFCPPEQLNDPLEGFKNVIWQGDAIAWHNLLKHYLLCLTLSVSTFCAMGDSFDSELIKNYAFGVPEDFKFPPVTDIYPQVCSEFFSQDVPNLLISTLAQQNLFLKRHSLMIYLRLLHPTALKIILSALKKNDTRLGEIADSLDEHALRAARSLKDLLSIHATMGARAETMLAVSENMYAEMALIHYSKLVDTNLGWLLITGDFPAFHINALERLIYPAWYTACFVADPTNTSMWGVYGDGHKGACLKFRVKRSPDDAHLLDLYRISGWNMSRGDEAPNPNYAYVSHRFEPVRYASDYPEIDFFESLGALSRYKLSGFWYAGENGERSATSRRILAESDEWRNEYWHKHSLTTTTKLPEWSHEQEYRLVLSSSISSFDDPSSRKLKYRFSDLAGIAFGIKTEQNENLEIINIIKNKCSANNISDFQFFQSVYLAETGKITPIPLTLLKFQI